MNASLAETLRYVLDKTAQIGAERLRVLVKVASSPGTLAMLAGTALVLVIEVVCLGYRRSSVYRLLHPTKTTLADMIFFLGKITALIGLVTALSTLGLSVIVTRLAARYCGWSVILRIDDPILRVLAAIVVTDFLTYWIHRARHGFGWWWELHKYHHAAEEFNGITTARGHPLDYGAITIFSAVPVAIFGGEPEDLLLVAFASGAHAALTHSMLDWRWGWFGKYVLYAPVGHRIHHSALPEHVDKNFGALFPVWDLMFGTLYQGDRVNETVGVDSNDFNREGFVRDMLVATKRAALAAVGRAAPGLPSLAPLAPASEQARDAARELQRDGEGGAARIAGGPRPCPGRRSRSPMRRAAVGSPQRH